MDRNSEGDDRQRRPSAGSIQEAVGSKTGRRRFLAALAAGGIGAGLALWPTGSDVRSAGRDEVPIVYGYVRSDPDDPASIEPRKKTVPAAWFDRLERAFEVNRRIGAADLAGLVGSFVIPGDHSDPEPSIAIQSTVGSVREKVADISTDVTVEFDVFEEIPDPTGDSRVGRPETVADLEQPSVPGGVFCGNDEVRGSLGPALYDEATGDRYFVTANHLYGDGGRDHRGAPLYLYARDDRETVGAVHRGFVDEDVVVAEPTGRYVPASEIAGTEPGAVGGFFTKHGLADLMARGEPLRMSAAISGETSGRIKGIDGTTIYTGTAVRTGQLLWGDETTFTDGDSGSVNFHVDPENDDHLLVGGFNNARTWWPGADFTWGTAAYRIREAHGFVF